MRAFLLHLAVAWQKFIYSASLKGYNTALRLASPWHSKAKAMLDGRKNWTESLKQHWKWTKEPTLWMHCASLGEFEQGRPVLEAYRKEYPEHKILLTFFSPSGYEIRKNYAGADYVTYLPFDSEENARLFLEIIQPDLAVFVKYEFWANYLQALRQKEIPCLLVSAIFRPNQLFFKSYGAYYRQLLGLYKRVFVQNKNSAELISAYTEYPPIIAGDTRFDRVLEITSSAKSIPEIEQYVQGKPAMVIGSSWPADIEVLMPIMEKYAGDIRFIIAPHEVDANAIQQLENQLQTLAKARYTQTQNFANLKASVLIIDTIGMLSSLYQYGKWAYVGGSFGKGLHNTLEAAVWGIPVFFGNRKYQKFDEALLLIDNGGAFPIQNSQELEGLLQKLLPEGQEYKKSASAAEQTVKQGGGATRLVMEYIANLYAGREN